MELLHTARLACLLIVFWNEIRSNESATTTMATTTMTPPMMYTCDYNFACNLSIFFGNDRDIICNEAVSPTASMEKRPNVSWYHYAATNESFWLVMITPDYFYSSCNYTGFLPIYLNWAVKATTTANSEIITLAAEDAFNYTAPFQSEETELRYQVLLYPLKTTGNENPFQKTSSGLNMSELLTRLKFTPAQHPSASFQFRLEVKPKEVPQERPTTIKDPGPTAMAPQIEQSSLSTCLKPTIPRGLMTMIGIVLAVVLA